jgi:hypothetical protein
VRNAGHVRGASATRWLGAIGVRYALAFENALP